MQSMPSIEQQVIFFYTRDLATTARFYEDLFGLKLALDQGSCRIYRVAGSAFVGFCERPDAPGGPSSEPVKHVILTFATHEVDAWYQRLVAAGVSFEKPPQLYPQYKIYHCFLRDPNGYLLEIQQFLDPAWPKS
jgi:catechol 2,3-dioxygenase-like lactoylglutathione lyase family enzyme